MNPLTEGRKSVSFGQVPKSRRRIVATIPIKHDLYLRSCARIRGISLTALLTRLVDLIGQDQLVASVLDDADEIKVRRKGEHRHRESANLDESNQPSKLHPIRPAPV